MKSITGFNSDTAKHLVLDSGAYFANYDVENDTYESAREGGKLLGATQGGGSFDAVPNMRQVEVDGVRGKAKGLERFQSWDVSLKGNFLEAKIKTLKAALVSAKVENVTGPSGAKYKKITPGNDVDLSDYYENITWVGTVSGYTDPLIIQVYNTINMSGLGLSFSDNNESKVALSFDGHYDYTGANTEIPPFAIYLPDDETGEGLQS